ncbi:alpha/beta hydrolase family protein [Paraurantiacibacter namhicola]|uniref:alpha/beta hydrolase family protein n=1 Tax=Paraurantiacibacter namhicola TaxID=645517 RepID=UPI0012ED4CFD|nr:alpha/beta hydrolase [Paraurantiacibacter namhicola]
MTGLTVLAAIPSAAFAKTLDFPAQGDYSHHGVADPLLGDVSWHIDTDNRGSTGPLIVWLQGSGAYPHFQEFTDGSRGYTFPRELFANSHRGHFMLIDKPGIPFNSVIEFDPERGRPVQLDGPEYRAGMSFPILVQRAVIAISHARDELGDKIDRVVIVGGSEGAQYVFAVAKISDADKAVGWGGIALPQYFDFIIEQRLRAERGEISRAEAQENVEEIFEAIGAIGEAPYALERAFMGESNRRWTGFGARFAIEDMLSLDIPLLLVQGGDDRAAPIINTDFAMMMFKASGKSNLDYWVYPEANHQMMVPDPDNEGSRLSLAPEIWARVWKWIVRD